MNNKNLKKSIMNEEEEKEIQQDYTNRLFSTNLFLSLKLAVFGLMRYLIFYLEDFHKNDVPFNNLIIFIFIFFYIFLQIVYGIICDNINNNNLIIFNVIGITLELLIVINVEFNIVLMITIFSLSLFYLFTGLIAKFTQSYPLFRNLVILFFFAVFDNIFFTAFYRDYFKTEKLGYFRYNIFIGGCTYALWTIFYFFDFNCKNSISRLKVSFEVGRDIVSLVSIVFREIQAEFNLEDSNSSSFNY